MQHVVQDLVFIAHFEKVCSSEHEGRARSYKVFKLERAAKFMDETGRVCPSSFSNYARHDMMGTR